jgi:soluble lytic murein transglycosylase
MRQESRFDPDAMSPVGAIGLFQIMTYTAENLADRAGVGHVIQGGKVDRSSLADPAINAAIAAQLTSDLLSMFSRSAAPVVASYNAGEERVAVWWATTRDLSEDFFVDTIPYSETRRFVREVLTNREAYDRIYGDQ